MEKKEIILNLIRGAFIGIGNIIPGVSGGTIALMLGIYERVLNALGEINLENVCCLFLIFSKSEEKRAKFQVAIKKMDVIFLMTLGIGSVVSIFSLSFLFTYLLNNYRQVTYSFFCGLIFVSIIIPYKLMTRKSYKEILSALLAILLVVGLSILRDQKEEKAALQIKANLGNVKIDNDKSALKVLEKSGKQEKLASSPRELAIYFFAAILAISAMILPGISGSFLLLLMGLYFSILTAIKTLYLPILLVFSLGCFIGLLAFSRFLNYILSKFYNVTLAFLLGLIIGSLYGIWPFKEELVIENCTFYLANTLPTFDLTLLGCFFSFLMGSVSVLLLNRYEDHTC